jgi:uncharacterized BrkB/YihY/UPF0761 family membrane protein
LRLPLWIEAWGREAWRRKSFLKRTELALALSIAAFAAVLALAFAGLLVPAACSFALLVESWVCPLAAALGGAMLLAVAWQFSHA